MVQNLHVPNSAVQLKTRQQKSSELKTCLLSEQKSTYQIQFDFDMKIKTKDPGPTVISGGSRNSQIKGRQPIMPTAGNENFGPQDGALLPLDPPPFI